MKESKKKLPTYVEVFRHIIRGLSEEELVGMYLDGNLKSTALELKRAQEQARELKRHAG